MSTIFVPYNFFNDNILFDIEFYKNLEKFYVEETLNDEFLDLKIDLLNFINIDNCIMCSLKTLYLGHCCEHIKNINVLDLYNDLINVFNNADNIIRKTIKLILMYKMWKLKVITNTFNCNNYKNMINIKEQITYLTKSYELEILLDIFTHQEIKSNINIFKIIFELYYDELLSKHIFNIKINNYFKVVNKIHKNDIHMTILTLSNCYKKVALDINYLYDENYNDMNIIVHKNVNKDTYHIKHNYEIIKVNLYNNFIINNVTKIINKIMSIVLLNEMLYSNNLMLKNITRLSTLENSKYMEDIKLNIMERALFYKKDANYIYVLKLVENKYYIGRTSNIIQRMKQHITSNGSYYTKKYKPIQLIEVINEEYEDDENNKTLEYKNIFNNDVRGGCWCKL